MDIGLAVGGAFLSSALNVLFDRLAPKAVLSDAENKQASNQSVSQWLDELRDAVDSAENLMEEINYEALRLKVEGQQQNLAEVSDLNLCLSDDFFLNIKEKLEDTIETLKDLQQQIEELIDRLLPGDANGKRLTVVSIVGMGGVGKTTLAKVVYNDEMVKDHFDLKAWFCVSEAYDAFRITKGLLQEIGSFNLKVDDNLNQLQVKLKESLKGKKFLIVLDDVWNDNYNKWDDLRNLFVQGDIGSKIIVTTRKESVALMMANEQISLDNLSIEVFWSLFKRHAFENMDPMAKCKGLPLALKTLAGMLRSKSEVEGWKRILRSEKRELPHNDILPALILSYNDLPAHLKRCFSYCAIFPKDYPFSKEQVIHLWIANGLILQEDKIIQDLGNQYFLELRSRSLFERVPNPSQGNIEKFLMHDLVNDLGQIASSKLCIRLEESQGSHMLEKGRHLSYSMESIDFEKLTPLYKLEHLRTLLPISFQHGAPLSKRVLHNILPRLTSLRALSLSNYGTVELPDTLFIKLKLLRFLDLSQTAIKRLPDSICALYNLETLLLSHCDHLEELPLQMEKLINLHHLDISNTSFLEMPLHLSKLKSLRVLVGAKFLLGGSSMEDLGELHNLYGSLSILELQNVVDRKDAVKAKMREKNHVDKLSLKWSESSADNSQTERDILDELRPHTNIKQLQITGYRGTKFPNWLADHSFLKLVELSLSKCRDCDSLPALGQLPSLKFLSIREMHQITKVTEEFYGSSSSKKPFYSLEKLEFANMPEWKQWHVLGNGEFPTLENLSIINFPELSLETPIQLSKFQVIGSPKVGVLEGMKQIVELSIIGCNSLTSLPFSILPSTLKRIRISRCQKLKLEVPVGYYNMFVEDLRLEECDCIDDISPELLPRARKLNVSNCHNLTRFLIPTSTESFYIGNCKNLEKLSVALPSAMTSLSIGYCEKLKWLPDHMQELLPSLKGLHLSNCPEIESFPQGGLPFNLQQLEIINCKKLVNGRKKELELVIYHDGSDEEMEHWELPCSIRRLEISNLKTLSSQDLKSLTSLKFLYIAYLPQIQSLLEEWRLPFSLSELYLYGHHELNSLGLCYLTSLLRYASAIAYCHNLRSLSESALPSALSELTIKCCRNLQSLSESALPSSLSKLTIKDFPNLQSLSESALPSSLSELTIRNCPNLQSLPVKGLPSSLSELWIFHCPLLSPLLEFQKGEYWPNIAQIPFIFVDGKHL
ncbi:hypothetical protein H5410_046167 [Solanum commersonii]|uniref:Uncharacterized protein n=1 Tax=Solanum commersonii TaxID=4109 RepID=A0A9J5XDM5_SOLCO|nr:hypothetical protein H5410_046167 [Solanum commersonii]